MNKLSNALLKLCKIHHSKTWHDSHLSLARKLDSQGKKLEALREYELILEDNPNDKVALAHLLIIKDRLHSSNR